MLLVTPLVQATLWTVVEVWQQTSLLLSEVVGLVLSSFYDQLLGFQLMGKLVSLLRTQYPDWSVVCMENCFPNQPRCWSRSQSLHLDLIGALLKSSHWCLSEY